jgi:cysteine desulfurase/selenocysteine lyase
LPDYTLDWNQAESIISPKTKIVSIAHVHNTTAVRNDVNRLGKLVKKADSYFFVDVAQSVPHEIIDFKSMNADAIAFSGHKMLGPTGIGVLVAKQALLDQWPPLLTGGSMIQNVTFEKATWAQSPDKFEAGTPPIAESYGLSAAIDYLNQLGMNKIAQHEKEITKYALEQMNTIPNVRIIGPNDAQKQGGTVLFDVKGMKCHEVALALDQFENVCIRSGMHCAQPFVESINKDGLCRASFYDHTTKNDIDVFIRALKQTVSFA